MPRLLILISLFVAFLGCGSAMSQEDPATTFLLSLRPALQDGGETPQTFAAWANARYLLNDASYLGEVKSLGQDIESHLFIINNSLILTFWSKEDKSVAVQVVLGNDAKLFSWSKNTSLLQGNRADLEVDSVPLFIRGVDGSYVYEGIGNLLEKQRLLLKDELGNLLESKDISTWTKSLTKTRNLLLEKKYGEAFDCLEETETALDALLRDTLDLPETTNRKQRFQLFHKLFLSRLELCEARGGFSQWKGPLSSPRQFPLSTRIYLTESLKTLLSQAEPEKGLRGYPVTAQLLGWALDDLGRAARGIALREQNHLAVFWAYLPKMLSTEPEFWSLEPANAQNLLRSADCKLENGQYILRCKIENSSEEEAAGSVDLSWGDQQVTKQFTIAPQGVIEYTFPLESQPTPGMTIKMAGVLDDGTPISPATIAVTVQDPLP